MITRLQVTIHYLQKHCRQSKSFRRRADKKISLLTDYFNGLLVVELFVPVEHPQEGERGEEHQTYSEEHVACETGKIDPLEDKL